VLDQPFVPPPYPYDRLDDLKAVADTVPGGSIDLSIGTPCDPPPDTVIRALATSGAERGYPPSVGTPAFRDAAAGWLQRRFDVRVEPDRLAACIGSKEFVAGLPQWLRLRRPDRDTVLYPAVSYPTYAMGATLAGCRAVPVPVDERWELDVGAIDEADADRALCLWVNTPGNPAGGLDDLGSIASWGRARGVPVVSDECYIEFTWDGPGRTILEHGDDGVLAVHSLSKRSNLAGTRVGFYAGDGDLVEYLAEVRRHAGFLVPGPVQAAAVEALTDDSHVDVQRERYRRRLQRMEAALAVVGLEAPFPRGGFYLWSAAPGGDSWGLAKQLATDVGALVSPGEFYGSRAAGHVRLAAVQPDDRIELLAERLGA
jgi:succinyldiaminopimelate transaminase